MGTKIPGDPNSGCAHQAKPVITQQPDHRGFMRESSSCPDCGYYVCHCGCGRELQGPYQ